MYVHFENSNSYGILNGLCNIYNTNPQTPLFVFMCFFFFLFLLFFIYFSSLEMTLEVKTIIILYKFPVNLSKR